MYVFSFYKLWQNNRHPFSRVVTPITAVGSSLLRAETRETRRLMLAALHFKTAPGWKKNPGSPFARVLLILVSNKGRDAF